MSDYPAFVDGVGDRARGAAASSPSIPRAVAIISKRTLSGWSFDRNPSKNLRIPDHSDPLALESAGTRRLGCVVRDLHR